MGILRSLDDGAAEALDLIGGHGAEVVVAGFELLAVDEQRVGLGERIAGLIEVAEQGEAAILQIALGAVRLSRAPAGDVIIDQLGRGGEPAKSTKIRAKIRACGR
jgi:hypothetical protein